MNALGTGVQHHEMAEIGCFGGQDYHPDVTIQSSTPRLRKPSHPRPGWDGIGWLPALKLRASLLELLQVDGILPRSCGIVSFLGNKYLGLDNLRNNLPKAKSPAPPRPQG